jgi:hypothetical protein
MSEEKREGPWFTSLHQYSDPLGRFTVRVPGDWTEFELTEDREGKMFSPQDDEPTTYFAVWVTQLGEHIVAEDLDALREGVEAGLAQLDGITIEESRDDLLSNLVKFERIYTFDDNGVVRKRRVWMLYVDTWTFVVVFQGETPEEYHYWLPMGNYSFSTFNIPHELWFASDRDLAHIAHPERAAAGEGTAESSDEASSPS